MIKGVYLNFVFILLCDFIFYFKYCVIIIFCNVIVEKKEKEKNYILIIFF